MHPSSDFDLRVREFPYPKHPLRNSISPIRVTKIALIPDLNFEQKKVEPEQHLCNNFLPSRISLYEYFDDYPCLHFSSLPLAQLHVST